MKKQFTIIALIFSTISLAQTWTQINVPTSENLNDIEFASSTVGYISGDNQTLLKTTDGGENWSVLSHTGITSSFPYHIGDLEFVSEMVGFCNVTNTGSTYKTIDGGLNWTLVDDMELGNFCYRGSIYAINENQVFLGGAGCFQSAMIKEFDNGTWSEKSDQLENFDASEMVLELDFLGQLGLAATNSKYMLRSTDSGQNWDTIPVDLTGNLTSVVIVDNQLAYAGYDEAGSGFGILKSTDGGITWLEDFNSATFFYPSYLAVAVSANGDVYSSAYSTGSSTPLMFESEDGTNWMYENVDEVVNSIDSYGQDVVFGVGENGYVITNTDFGTLNQVELDSKLNIQVFPNPASETITVTSYEKLDEMPVLLSLQGKKVDVPTYANQLQYELNISKLSPGMYVLQLTKNGIQKQVEIIKE